jgi:acyl transferase domain-containing protein
MDVQSVAGMLPSEAFAGVGGRYFVGVSSFGAGGTNAHAIFSSDAKIAHKKARDISARAESIALFPCFERFPISSLEKRQDESEGRTKFAEPIASKLGLDDALNGTLSAALT